MLITQQINDVYEALDTSKADAARRIGISPTGFNFWLTGKAVPRDFLRRRMEREFDLEPWSLGTKSTDEKRAVR